jgi:hypothetical protein
MMWMDGEKTKTRMLNMYKVLLWFNTKEFFLFISHLKIINQL